MKKNIFTLVLMLFSVLAYSQVTYYWVGGTGPSPFTTGTNWNTLLDGTGTARTVADPTDILIFSGTNIGGTIPATGVVTTSITSTTVGQIKLINNASVVFTRTGGGTGTITISGSGVGDDFVVEAGSSLTINPATADGNIVISLPISVTGRVSGSILLANGQHRIVSQTTGGLVFTSTGTMTTSSLGYPFGSSSATPTPVAIEKGVVFESGSHLYYNGGNSPMGNAQAFSAIDFKSGSNYHIRSVSGTGSFLNTKIFGNIFIENNTNFVTDGPIYRVENFTVTTGSSFTVHTSGSTVVTGNLVVDGTIGLPATTSNVLVMAGSAPQTISGAGTITVPNFIVADNSDVSLEKNITVNVSANIYGKINFNNNRILGPGTFTSRVKSTAAPLTGSFVNGSYQVTGVTGVSGVNGLTVTGVGIAPNTSVVAFSTNNSTLNLSKPVLSAGTGVALTFSSDTATLATSNPNGMDSTTGSVVVTGTKTFQSGTNYIINAATSWPFGVSSGSSNTFIHSGFVEINAPVTVNRSVAIYAYIAINSKMTLRPLDTVRITNGATITGSFNSSNYIVTTYNPVTGEPSVLEYDGLSSSKILPIGTSTYYLPVTLNPASPSDFAVSVFEGITTNGLITGTPLSAAQKQTVVNAVWNINQINGSGTADVQLAWQTPLEGSTFTTLPDSDIGLIANTGSSWALPVGTGNNTSNIVTANLSSFGSLSAGAVPSTQPFIFNALPVKIYGNADFNGGATSLNTTQPIIYSSNNPAVATIVNGNIHITGAGTATITASQVTDGFYPAASVDQLLTVNPAALTITADNKTKFEGQANPTLTASYTGFVLGENASVLLTQPLLTTTAITNAVPGTYPITVSGATAANYSISFVNGTLTVQPKQNQTITFNAPAVKTYGNADFAIGATSTNNTIPITYTSSNTSVATIVGNNIHITGAGTSTITASQAGNAGYFPAPDVSRTLTVNKANLTIRVRDTLKTEGESNPPFTITYTGFVLGQNSTALTTQPVVTTTATTTSSAGYYSLTPEGASAANYNISYAAGRLTILPRTGAGLQHLNAYMSNSNTLTVRVYSPQPALADIMVFDFSGKPLLKTNLFMPAGFISANLAVGKLPSGIYIVKVKGEGVDLQQTVPIIR